jgi:hypothetical protein
LTSIGFVFGVVFVPAPIQKLPVALDRYPGNQDPRRGAKGRWKREDGSKRWKKEASEKRGEMGEDRRERNAKDGRRKMEEGRGKRMRKEERREKREESKKMPGLRRGFLGGRRLVFDKCFLNSTLCTPR